MFRTLLIAVASLALISIAALSSSSRAGGDLTCTAGFFADDAIVEQTIEDYRAKGPEGLQEAFAWLDQVREWAVAEGVDADQIRRGGDVPAGERAQLAAEMCGRMSEFVDRIAGQRGAAQSRLYWYTDLDQAKAAAVESGKPILSLRMLGKLTDEYSCANSRFFRTALYTNQEISDYLRDNFVLHWQSVRPVPRVMIDFGDGRKLERTVTGNSAHYILDATGRPLDVLPGLYGPKAFQRWVHRSHVMAQYWASIEDPVSRDLWLATHHAKRLARLEAALAADLAVLPAEAQPVGFAPFDAPGMANAKTIAMQAQRASASKAAVEARVVQAVLPAAGVLGQQSEEFWRLIAQRHMQDAELDQASIDKIRRENPTARQAADAAVTKTGLERPIMRLAANFQQSMAVDTVKNEYTFHRTIHQLFANSDPLLTDFDALNEYVYATLFLTPSSDPWLGLAPTDVYTALEDGGLTVPN